MSVTEISFDFKRFAMYSKEHYALEVCSIFLKYCTFYVHVFIMITFRIIINELVIFGATK